MRPGEPPPPSRTRMVRPSFYRAESTGALAPDVRDLLIGLMTIADDTGWLLWRPGSVAATLYPYEAHGRRIKSLERRAAVLVAGQLLDIRECGCAYLPTLLEHGAIKGGDKTKSIWTYHFSHQSVGLRSDTEQSVHVSGSESSSSSVYEQASASSRAPDDATAERAASSCAECGRPTTLHKANCGQAPWLRVVNA